MNKEIGRSYASNVKAAKSCFYLNKLNLASGDQKKTWKILKSIVNGVSNGNSEVIEFEGEMKHNNKEIAESFNKYFIESVKEINNKIPTVVDSNQQLNARNIFEFDITNVVKVESVLRNIKSKSDFEFLNKRILIDALPVIGLPFVDVINTSMEVGECPDSWKVSMLIPIPKVPGTIKCNEYRPVNMLPTYEKVLEAVVKEQLEEFVKKIEIVIEEQSGFRKGHSCESALNLVIANWKEQNEDGNIIVAVFLDLKRAFETIDRKRLIKKLENIGIKGKELRWFSSYLSKRMQKTTFNGEVSDELEVELGVPQGAKLASILFLLYINDMKDCLEFLKLLLFADDTLVYYCGKDIDEICERVNSDLDRINKWLCVNKLKLNTDKTKFMVISSKKINQPVNIRMDNESIERVYVMKYLGFMLDCNLKLTKHVDYLCKKIARKVGFLARISNKLSFEHRIVIYKSIIAPHFEYCASILSNCNKGDMSRLQKLQNRAMRIILRCKKRTHIQDMLDALQWLNVKQRIMLKTLVTVFKVKHNMMPKYLSKKISYVGEVQQYPLRNDGDFRLPMMTTENNKNSLVYNSLKEFNKMPSSIKMESDLKTFKRKVTDYVKLVFK